MMMNVMDHEKWLEQHDRMMADHEIAWAKHEEAWARHQEWLERHDKAMAELETSQAKTEKTLRWAIRLGVQDARRQRERNREFTDTMTRIEQMIKAFLDRGGNGKH